MFHLPSVWQSHSVPGFGDQGLGIGSSMYEQAAHQNLWIESTVGMIELHTCLCSTFWKQQISFILHTNKTSKAVRL